eukprot:86219_1
MIPVDPCYSFFSFSTKQIAAHQSEIAQALFKPPNTDQRVQLRQCIDLILHSLIHSSSLAQFQSECNQILTNAFQSDKTAHHDDYLWISVVFFSVFMRCNFVGPFALTDYEIMDWDEWFKHDLFKNDGPLTALKCHEWLRVDQEDIEFELKYPFLLVLCSVILQNGVTSTQNKDNLSWHWWYVRVLRYHQTILSHRCPTIQDKLLSHCTIIETLFPDSFMNLHEIQQQINSDTIITLKQLLQCQFHIEYTWIANVYWKHDIVKAQMNAAKQCLSNGFIYELTSKLGKRTKFQRDSKAQLLLMIQSSIYRFFPAQKEENAWFLPHNIPLDDDTLLDQIQWDLNGTDEQKECNATLHYLEYCILLFESIQNTVINKVKGISELIVLAYLDRLNLDNHIYDWCIQTLVLLQRSRTEFTNYSKQTRAIQQYECLQAHLESMFNECRVLPSEYIALKRHYTLQGVSVVDNDNNKENQLRKETLNKAYDVLCRDIAWERVRGIYGTSLKSQSHILCELGDLYEGLGFHQSALAIYQKLKHYHKVSTCLVNLGRKHDAMQMLLKQIEEIDATEHNVTIPHHYTADKKPYYLCLLGDVTDDISYYEQAWEVSGKTYGRAMRTLSYHYYHQKEYAKCIECARHALSINSLFPKVWFLLGAAAMHIKPEPMYDRVIEAFSFVVSIEPTDFEAWNNLGAAHLHLKHYKSALHALQEAGNLRRDNWKIWENILTCALKLKKLSKSISTLSHLLEIKRNTMSLNPNVIAALTIELTHKIQQYQLQNDELDEKEETVNGNGDEVKEQEQEQDENEIQTKTEEEKISKRSLVSLVNQFDRLVKNILGRLSEHSFISGTSHVNESPFTKTGLKNESMMSGVDESQRAKQTQFAYDIHEMFSIYFEKSLRLEECIETRFKQSQIMVKYFEFVCKGGQRETVKETYLKMVHVLSQLTQLYSMRINDEESALDIQKLQQMLTSIQLLFNRSQRLSDKLYVELKESKQLTVKLQEMEQITYKRKNDEESKRAENKKHESAMSAFSDWM